VQVRRVPKEAASVPDVREHGVDCVTLTALIGGPQDGKVADTNGKVPTLLLSEPRERTLFDEPKVEATWNELTEWYELSSG
jgi:hypothetical protein